MHSNKNLEVQKGQKRHEFEIVIPTKIAKEFANKIKDGKITNIKLKTRKKINKNESKIVMTSEKKVDMDDLMLGIHLNELKFTSAASIKQREAKKLALKEKNGYKKPLRLEFPRAVVREFNQLYKDKFNVTKVVVDGKSSNAAFYFDISHIDSRIELAKFVLEVADTVVGIRDNYRFQHEQAYIGETIRFLNSNCGSIEQTKIHYVEMTGDELIKKGHANRFSWSHKNPGILDKFSNMIASKTNEETDWFYINHLVDRTKDYVVKLDEPIQLDEPRIANHKDEVLLRYKYGEQLFAGYGGKLVEQYAKEITDIQNQFIDKMKAENAAKKSDSKETKD